MIEYDDNFMLYLRIHVIYVICFAHHKKETMSLPLNNGGKKGRWSKTCQAARFLREDFVQGAIAADSFDPKQVQSTRTEYMEYDPACFARNIAQISRDFVKASDAGTTFLQKWLEDGKVPTDSGK